jgi:YVTN family beta-propeller protein
MPPLPLALFLQATLPWLSRDGRAVINGLVATRGNVSSADEMAHRVGLPSRFSLARLLRREGLPPFGELADWASVLQLLWDVEATDRSLLQLAIRAGMEPATCYRRCRRVLGVPWRVARPKRFGWALLQFLTRCPRPKHGGEHLESAAGPQVGREMLVLPAPPSAVVETSRTPQGPAAQQWLTRSGRTPSRGPSPRVGGPLEGTVLAAVPLADAPTDVAVSRDGVAYVARAYGASVERFNPATRTFTGSIAVGNNPTRIVFDRAGERAYVTNQFSDTISVLDVATDTVVDTLTVSGNPAPLLVAPDQRTLYVTTNLDVLYAISLRLRRVVASVPLPATSHHLALHPDRPRLYVATRDAGTVIELGMPSHRVVRTFDLGGQTQAMVIDPDGTELYVANESGRLDVIDLDGGERRASVRLEGGAYGLDLTPDGAQLYVTFPALGRVDVIDRASLRTVHRIAVGGTPRHTAFDIQSRTALIANEGGWVTVVA